MKGATIALLVLFASACAGTTADFRARHDALLAIYHSGNASDAEEAIVQQLELIDRAQAERTSGLQFDDLRWVAYLRLSRARDVLGKKDASAHDFATALQLFRSSGRAAPSLTDGELSAQLATLADGLEKEVTPAWKKR
jgi:hypothetical protein